jgi:two-component system CheB/CheR fusion protein
MDIVSCRNVMIYFNQTLQRHIMSTFHYALDPGGYMLLGMSEGLREYGDAFFAVSRKHKIYSKLSGGPRVEAPLAREYRQSAVNPPGRSAGNDHGELWREADLQRAADRIVLARFGPPALVVDDRMNVLQARGQTSPLIQLSPGTVSWNLGRVLRIDIVNEVRKVVQRSIQENIAVSITLEIVEEDKGSQQLQVDVLPIANTGPMPRCFLILFQLEPGAAAAKGAARIPSAVAELDQDEKDKLMFQLRQDLNASRLHLQTVLEERDARNQELVSASEEIQSANEELQSTNEELETTKEELQSTNEELQTVNDELQQRNLALEQSGNDLRNLLNSVSIPLLMLTSDLHIRQFTPPMQKLIRVLPSDIGRPISDIRLHLNIEDLDSLLREVSETLVMHESDVQDKEGRWYLLRIRPYRTSDNKIEGLVIVLVDIDQLRSSQQNLIEARDFSQTLVENVPIPVVALDQACNIKFVNTAFRELTTMRTKELTGRSLPDLAHHLWGLDSVGQRLDDLSSAEEGSSFTFEHKATTSDELVLLVRGQCLSADGRCVLLLVMEDITLRRKAEEVLSSQNRALEWEVKSAAAELDGAQVELGALTAHLFTVQEEERQRIARELHDDVSQRLSLLDLILGGVASAQPPAEATQKIEEARNQLQSLSTDVRTLSHQLHPAVLDDLGLSAALKALVAEFGKREGMLASYISRNLPDLPAQPAVTALYRITQEALRNVAKHAGMTHVKVILEPRDKHLHLEVRDLGVGFDTDSDTEQARQGLGMITMRERARLAHGTVTVHSALGEGTTVSADNPLPRRCVNAC